MWTLCFSWEVIKLMLSRCVTDEHALLELKSHQFFKPPTVAIAPAPYARTEFATNAQLQIAFREH